MWGVWHVPMCAVYPLLGVLTRFMGCQEGKMNERILFYHVGRRRGCFPPSVFSLPPVVCAIA